MGVKREDEVFSEGESLLFPLEERYGSCLSFEFTTETGEWRRT